MCGYLPDRELQDVVNISLAAGCQLLSVPRSIEVAGVHPSLVWRHGRPLMELTAPKLQGQQLAIKRVVDIVGASLGLVVLSPLLALVALAVAARFRPARSSSGRSASGWAAAASGSGSSGPCSTAPPTGPIATW